MFDDLTWNALLQAWPWFAAAATVFVVTVALFIALKPKRRKPHSETAADAADNMAWTLTRRIDLTDPQSAGTFVLQVEESRISMSPTGVEHREIRWRRATLLEAKMVLKAYHAQQNLGMSGSATVSGPIETKREQKMQGERGETELEDVGNGHDAAENVTLVPGEVVPH